MNNKPKLMISKKVADRSHFGWNIESLLYKVTFFLTFPPLSQHASCNEKSFIGQPPFGA